MYRFENHCKNIKKQNSLFFTKIRRLRMPFIKPWKIEMTQEEAIERLSRYQSQEDSAWRVEEERLQYAKSKGWLRYSRRIAIKVALAMKQQNLSRQDVADRMGCTPQYVSRLLKGEENLSLETICKLENALNVAILQYEFM